jgi:4-carboxymuconolactone decarboxylase
MTDPAGAEVDEVTRQAFARLSVGDAILLAENLGCQEQWLERSGLDARSFHLVKIAALVAQHVPPGLCARQVRNAVAVGVAPREILGVLIAIASEVGGPRVVTAAPEIVRALSRQSLDLAAAGRGSVSFTRG